MRVFSKIRRGFVVSACLLSALIGAPASGQLTCEAPLEVGLGSTSFATLLPFPDREASVPCNSSWTLHHAVYFRFTAPQDGWYALHAVSTGQTWQPLMAVLTSCDASAPAALGPAQGGRALCDAGDSAYRGYASVSVRMQSGESRIIAVGGFTTNDFGSGQLRAVRIGDTLMEGAQPLSLGANSYSVAALEPPVPYGGACAPWSVDRMGSASRFTFTPGKSGTYRISFCGAAFRSHVALSDSPDMPQGSLLTSVYGCPENAGRISAPLSAGTTYYIVAGYPYGNEHCCQTHNATVEYVEPCPADLTDDDSVDGEDLATLLSGWGTAAADITNDGNTDGVDLAILLASWGKCTD